MEGFPSSSFTTPSPLNSLPTPFRERTGLHTVIRAVVAMTMRVDFVSIFSPPDCKERESLR
jgi:hypothetical protein